MGNTSGNGEGTGEQGIPVAEAAARLGISRRAVRLRIERGTLKAWQIATDRGKAWRVDPEGLEGTAHPEATGNTSGTEERPASPSFPVEWEAERAALLDKIAGLEADKARLWNNVEAVQAHAAELARMLEQEQHNQRALEAKLVRALPAPEPYETVDPVKRPDIPTGTSEQDAPAEPAQVDIQVSTPGGPEQRPRRPWWKLW